MIISLIGMSGSGKSYWSKKLRPYGFKLICCDDLIEHELGRELKNKGFSGIRDVARWMGQPYDPQYAQTSARYLEIEEKVVSSILKKIEQISTDKKIIIDTTGSVIYLQEETLEKLKRLTTVLSLETPDHVKKRMFTLYIHDPKPVIWGDRFNKKPNESNSDALARCYPQLLEYRTRQYAKYADIIVRYETRMSKNFHVEDLLKEIDSYHAKTACFF